MISHSDIKLKLDSKSSVYVTLPKNPYDQAEKNIDGLCGKMNGDPGGNIYI